MVMEMRFYVAILTTQTSEQVRCVASAKQIVLTLFPIKTKTATLVIFIQPTQINVVSKILKVRHR